MCFLGLFSSGLYYTIVLAHKENIFSCNYSYKMYEWKEKALKMGPRTSSVVLSSSPKCCCLLLLAKCCSRFIIDPVVPGSGQRLPAQEGFLLPSRIMGWMFAWSVLPSSVTGRCSIHGVGFCASHLPREAALLGLVFPLLLLPQGSSTPFVPASINFSNIQLLFLSSSIFHFIIWQKSGSPKPLIITGACPLATGSRPEPKPASTCSSWSSLTQRLRSNGEKPPSPFVNKSVAGSQCGGRVALCRNVVLSSLD